MIYYKLYAKCSNNAHLEVVKDDKTIYDKDGYLPSFLGDELYFEINPNTGKILNWDKIKAKEFNAEINPKKKLKKPILKTYTDYILHNCDREDRGLEDLEIPKELVIQECLEKKSFCYSAYEFLNKEDLKEYYLTNNQLSYGILSEKEDKDKEYILSRIEKLKNDLKDKYQNNINYFKDGKALFFSLGQHELKGMTLYRFYSILELLLENGFYSIKHTETLSIFVGDKDYEKVIKLLKENNIIYISNNVICINDLYLLDELSSTKYRNESFKYSSSDKREIDNSILEKYL